jgi:cell division protein FtsI (penicillin-binding protein 3)
LLRPSSQWQPLDHATIAFGQGVSVTPIQLAAASAALANGGNYLRPRLVAARRVAGGRWQPTTREVAQRVLRPETARAVLAMLETVVSPTGTGHRAALHGVRVAGKTGTAQKWDAEAGRYSNDRFRAWFLGIVPADDPKLVIVVGLDEPQRPTHSGGRAAAPLFAKVAAAQLARFGIFESGPELPTRVAAAQNGNHSPASPEPPIEIPEPTPHVSANAAPDPEKAQPVVQAELRAAQEHALAVVFAGRLPPSEAPVSFASLGGRVLLPDFSDLSVDEVTRITESAHLIVRVRGRGRAIQQDPPPGTIVPSGGIVTIEFGEAVPRDSAARSRNAPSASRHTAAAGGHS